MKIQNASNTSKPKQKRVRLVVTKSMTFMVDLNHFMTYDSKTGDDLPFKGSSTKDLVNWIQTQAKESERSVEEFLSDLDMLDFYPDVTREESFEVDIEIVS